MTDYDSWCLWDMETPNNIDPNKLPISDDLKSDLSKWTAQYDATLMRDNPIASGFSSDKALNEFVRYGWLLFERLKVELPETEFFFFDESSSSLYDKNPLG